MAIRANQRQVRISEQYIRSRCEKAFEAGEKIVGVSLQHTLDENIPDLVIFLVEKPDDEG